MNYILMSLQNGTHSHQGSELSGLSSLVAGMVRVDDSKQTGGV